MLLSYFGLSAISFVSGVYVSDFFSCFKTVEIVVLTIVLCAILSLFIKKYRRRILISSLFLILGTVGCAIHQNPVYNKFNDINNKYVTIEGYVTDLPEEYGGTYSYKLKTTRAEYMGNEYTAGQIIKLTSNTQLKYGESVRVKGFLKELSEKNNSSDFNVKRYYQSRNIFYRMYARETEIITSPQKYRHITYYVNLIKSKYADAIDREFSGDESAVLKAVTIGNKRQFSDDFNDLISKTGIKKFFYPAFLHIYLISLFVAVIFKHFKKSTRDYILILAMFFYAVMNNGSPALVKSAFAVIIGMIILKKYGFSHTPDIISLTILVIAFSNPLYCFDVGFIISLSTGLMLYYFSDILESLLRFIPNAAIRRFLIFYIITTFGLLPVISYFFNGLTLYTNLLSPLYTLAVTALLILTPIMCIISSLFGNTLIVTKLISLILRLFTALPKFLDNIPFSHIWIKPPSIIFIAAFFLTLYILYQIYMHDIKKKINICAVCACAGLWCGLTLNYIHTLGNMDIIFVNVGQGDGIVINIKGGETILVDGGGKYSFSDYDAGKHIYAPYLADNGYFNIDKAFVTHFHSDHCLGIISAMRLYDIGEVVIPDYGEDNIYRLEIEKIAKEKNITITYAEKGDVFNLPSGLNIKVLSPVKGEPSADDENAMSVVTEFEYNGFRCLLTGDIGTEQEKRLIKDISDCDVVKMAHHGSANSNCTEFAEAVKAEYAIVCAGENNIYDFPKKEAIYNYQQSGTKIAGTDVNGDITVSVNKRGKYKIYRKDGNRSNQNGR